MLDQKIEQIMREHKIPGLSLAIVEDGNIVALKAYGFKNILPPHFVDENTIFEAASLSKPIFAYGVLKMVEKEQLDLDTPLSEYFKNTDVKEDLRLTSITARMVLSHTTGFPNWRPKNHGLKIHFQPGEKFSYSGEGFAYLQKVVEKVSAEPLEQYMQDAVFAPLDMAHSSYLWPKEHESTKATGYDSAALPLKAQGEHPSNAAFTLHTTAGDYAKFAQAIIKNIGLQETTINEMLSSQITAGGEGPFCIDKCVKKLSSSVSWGLGWGLQKTTKGISFWHWGDNQGFKSYVAGYKEGSAVVIFTNSDNGLNAIREIIYEITGMRYPAFDWLGYK